MFLIIEKIHKDNDGYNNSRKISIFFDKYSYT